MSEHVQNDKYFTYYGGIDLSKILMSAIWSQSWKHYAFHSLPGAPQRAQAPPGIRNMLKTQQNCNKMQHAYKFVEIFTLFESLEPTNERKRAT